MRLLMLGYRVKIHAGDVIRYWWCRPRRGMYGPCVEEGRERGGPGCFREER